MGDFLERAADFNRNANGGYGDDFALVAKAIAALQLVHSKAELDLYNLESVFGALEMARMLGRMPGCSDPEAITKIVVALRSVIAQTLERSIAFPCKEGRFQAPLPYIGLTSTIAEINRKERGDMCSIISFNYDILAEVALYATPLGYWDAMSPVGGRVSVLKLHGSLNWGTCRKCKCLVPLPMDKIYDTVLACSDQGGSIQLPISSMLVSAKLQHCEEAIDPIPVIVPPSWNKTGYAESVGQIWQEAARQLSDAENIFVCGYSLPETDVFFKHLFALGSVGTSLIRRFWVINPDPDGGVEGRFRGMLGKAALSRFKMFKQTFSALYSLLYTELGLTHVSQLGFPFLANLAQQQAV